MAVLLPLVLPSVEPVVEPVVEPGEPAELPLGDEGVVVEDEEPEDVPAASSVLRLQAPSVSTADNARASMTADLAVDAYISVPF
jgi:hypothetical protein